MTLDVQGILRKMDRAGKNKLKIFLVDYDLSCTKVISHQLNSIFGKRVEVTTFKDGEDCLASLCLEPDLVLMDHYLKEDDPQATGLILMKKVKQYSSKINVILMSGLGDMQLAVRALKEGAMDYLVKGKNFMDRLLTDFTKIIEKYIHMEQENQYASQKKLIKIAIGSLAVGTFIAYVLLPAIFDS